MADPGSASLRHLTTGKEWLILGLPLSRQTPYYRDRVADPGSAPLRQTPQGRVTDPGSATLKADTLLQGKSDEILGLPLSRQTSQGKSG